ncbi:MAG: SDR family oxidoreductase [Bacilli bacterium]
MLTVLITGASSGIGEAIYNLYKEKGYRIIAPTIDDLDLSDRESVLSFIEKHKEEKIDILINDAGVNFVNDIENVNLRDLDYMMSVNLFGPILLLKAFVPSMKKNKFGRIVNICSIWSQISRPGRSIYSATKRGLSGITETLAVELAKDNIIVNSVSPGFTLTELTRRTNTPDEIKTINEKIPLGRMADPQEIARVVFFLGNENNTYLTGQNITVDGGFTKI